MTNATMRKSGDESMEKTRISYVHGSGWRRTDVYGFERYEDTRRDWYVLSGEDEARRYATHDRAREARCTQALLALIFEN